MNNITNHFGSLYHPTKAFLLYRQNNASAQVYIETYDIAPNGQPVNAHPLSITEGAALAKALRTSEHRQSAYLKPTGLMPGNLLYLNPEKNGFAVWHTPKQHIKLLFKDDLGIPCGNAAIPALIWKATKNSLTLYAIQSDGDINLQTELFHAPFFNIYADGRVCMGNVKISIPKDCGLEQFICRWQSAFFDSYFSHMMQGHNPVKGNMVQLWKSLAGTKRQFPLKSLMQTKFNLKNLIR